MTPVGSGSMADRATPRASALAARYAPGLFGLGGEAGVTLREIPDLTLHQVAAWPETLASVGAKAANVGHAREVWQQF